MINDKKFLFVLIPFLSRKAITTWLVCCYLCIKGVKELRAGKGLTGNPSDNGGPGLHNLLG